MKISASTAPSALPYKYRQGQPATSANTQMANGLCHWDHRDFWAAPLRSSNLVTRC